MGDTTQPGKPAMAALQPSGGHPSPSTTPTGSSPGQAPSAPRPVILLNPNWQLGDNRFTRR